MKRALTILLIGTVFVLLFIGAWWFLMRATGQPATETVGTTTRSFNPFGIFTDTTDGGAGTATDETASFPDTPFADQQKPQVLSRISEKPVAGVATLQVKTGTSTEYFVRYVERETGHLYDYSLTNKQSTRLSNTTIPRVQEALFGNSGNTVVFRRIQDDGETVETYFGMIDSASTSTPDVSRLSGMFLPQNILAVATHPTENKVFYTLHTDTGSSGYVITPTGTSAVFSHPFYQWRASWNGSSVILSTAPSYTSGGIAFSLNPLSGALDRISSTTLALTVLPGPDTDTLLYGEVGRVGPQTFVYNQKTHQSRTLSVATLPEKCVWGGETLLYCAIPNNSTKTVPDEWYQGVISFTDTLWQVDTDTGLVTYILDPTTLVPAGLDMTHLTLSGDGTHLTFINKKDGSLWLVDLSLAHAATPTGNPFSY